MSSIIYQEKDSVYTIFGYGIIINCGSKQQIEIKEGLNNKEEKKNEEEKKDLQEDSLNQQQNQKEIKQQSDPQSQNGQQQQLQQEPIQQQNIVQKAKDSVDNPTQESQQQIPQTLQPQNPEHPHNTKNNQNNNQNQSEQNYILVKLKCNGFLLQIPECGLNKDIKKQISLQIKTFFGTRKVFEFKDIDIRSTIDSLKTRVIQASEQSANSFYNLRLIYPMAQILSLPSAQTLEQLSIPDKAQLILFVQTTFFWNPAQKGPLVKLSNNNLTASKSSGSEQEFQNTLGNLPLSSGRHYWEVRIDLIEDENDLIIGIARENLDVVQQPLDSQLFHGYFPLLAKKCLGDGNLLDYGHRCNKNDTVGVLLEFKAGTGNLSFFKNGIKCGVAFNNLQGTFFPTVCMSYGEVQVTLDPKAALPANI